MIRFTSSRWSGLLLALALPLTTGSSIAADARPAAPELGARKAAEQHFARGTEFYALGDFAPARAEFERAYAVSPDFRVLFNVGQARYQLHDYAGAIEAFERYLRDGGRQLSKLRVAEVEAALQKLAGFVGSLRVVSSSAGLAVEIDGEAWGYAPTERRRVNPGTRRVSLKRAGQTLTSKTIEVFAGETRTLELEAEPETRALPGPLPAPAAQRSKAPMIAGYATASVFLIAATVAGGLTLSARADTRDRKSRAPVGADELATSASKVNTLALVTDVCLAGALVAAGVGLYFQLQPSEVSERSSVARVGGAQLGLNGHF